MPKTLYLSPCELATVVDALTLYAADLEDPPTSVRTGQIEHSPPFGRLRPPRLKHERHLRR